MYGGGVANTHVKVTVCRGCCGDSSVKHPDGDHNGALAVLTRAVEGSRCGAVRRGS
jgi:hypothetical protein